jgi:hypothetical protein
MRRLIRADGTEQALGKVSIVEARALIGADVVAVVALRHLGDPLQIMVINDLGYKCDAIPRGAGEVELFPTQALKPINPAATRLYHANCKPGTTHKIVGDVVIVFDDDFD